MGAPDASADVGSSIWGWVGVDPDVRIAPGLLASNGRTGTTGPTGEEKYGSSEINDDAVLRRG